jgi:C-terminal processing protease CtpA/Prc
MAPTNMVIDADLRSRVVDGVLRQLHAHYIFPDTATAMEQDIRRRMGKGEYDVITSGAVLAAALTAHLQEVSHDKHLRVFFSPEPRPVRETGEPSPEEREEFNRHGMLHNYGFKKVERLVGNIGYLELHEFFPAEIGDAGATAVAAMNFLAHTDALIVDLRQNGGGDPTMIALISSYLFAERVHLNSLYWRDGDRTEQFWTLPYVPGKRYGDKPVYILTSNNSFSGAEEFTYNLKNLKRATIVGETTGGGAHPTLPFPIDEHFGVGIPAGRSISPITGTNWEGTGVTPDIAVRQERALTTAHILALKDVIERAGDNLAGPLKEVIDEARATLAQLEKRQPKS